MTELLWEMFDVKNQISKESDTYESTMYFMYSELNLTEEYYNELLELEKHGEMFIVRIHDEYEIIIVKNQDLFIARADIEISFKEIESGIEIAINKDILNEIHSAKRNKGNRYQKIKVKKTKSGETYIDIKTTLISKRKSLDKIENRSMTISPLKETILPACESLEIQEAIRYMARKCPNNMFVSYNSNTQEILAYEKVRSFGWVCQYKSKVPEKISKKLNIRRVSGISYWKEINEGYDRILGFINNQNISKVLERRDKNFIPTCSDIKTNSYQDFGYIRSEGMSLQLKTIDDSMRHKMKTLIEDEEVSISEYKIPKISKLVESDMLSIGNMDTKKGIILRLHKGENQIAVMAIKLYGNSEKFLKQKIVINKELLNVFKKDLLSNDILSIIYVSYMKSGTNQNQTIIGIKIGSSSYQTGVI